MIGYGSWNTRLASLHSAVKKGNLSTSATINHSKSNGFSSQDTDDEDDGYENTSLRGKASYQITEKANLYLTAHYINTESEYDSSYPGNLDPTGLAESEQVFAAVGANVLATDVDALALELTSAAATAQGLSLRTGAFDAASPTPLPDGDLFILSDVPTLEQTQGLAFLSPYNLHSILPHSHPLWAALCDE